MIRSALDLGAPVTEPGGNVASSSSRHPAPSRSSPRTVETRWTRPGCSSTAHSAGTVTDPVAQTRPMSLRTRSTIITFSAWSFSNRSAAVGPGGVGQRRGQHTAEVRLVDLAGRDVLADAAHSGRIRGAVEGGRPVAGGGSAPGAGHGLGNGPGADVREAGADEAALEVGGD